MATPMTAAQIVKQLQKFGIPYKEYRDWKTHNRNHKGAWGPVHGLMVHHTGSDSTDQRALLYNGLAGLPGPLCHFGLAQDGTIHLVGWGRANHAGLGDDDVLKAVIAETALPRDDESNTDGNARFYGVEIWYSGSHAMTDAQYKTLRLLAAAICDFHEWDESSVIGHGEWGSPGKWDPGIKPGVMMDMDDVRKDIKATLGTPKAPTPQPSKTQVLTVKAGQTLGVIAASVGLSVAALLGTNPHITNPDVIHPGDKVTVPATPPASTSKPTPAPSSKPATKPKPKPKASAPKFPGTKYFRPGANNRHVTALGKALVKKGYGRFYRVGPGPRWGEADRKAVQAFQKAQGWKGSAADGYPGPQTWARLMK